MGAGISVTAAAVTLVVSKYLHVGAVCSLDRYYTSISTCTYIRNMCVVVLVVFYLLDDTPEYYFKC